MATERVKYEKVWTPTARICWPHLDAPWGGPRNDSEPKYCATFLIPKNVQGKDAELLKTMREKCDLVTKKTWPEKLPANLKRLFKDGDEMDLAECKGHWVFTARTKEKPGVVTRANVEVKEPEKIKELIYPGCWVRATVAIGANEFSGSKYQHALLNNLQFVRDDARFDGKAAATSEFEALETSETQEDFADSF
jgi:hypothetical protein